MNKKLLVFLFVCVLALPTALNVFAANTSDMPINFDVNATNFNVKTGARNKENSTAVYCKITDLENNSKVRVRALACNADSEVNKTRNGTSGNWASYVTLTLGTRYSIHTHIYEDGYRSAKLAFQSLNLIFSEHVEGWWSPDSKGSYTDAWQ